MDFNELFKKASLGDEIALEELIDAAEQGEADAQFLLSCLYEQDGPQKNEEQADYWLDMAAYNGHEQAKQKYYEKPLKPIKNLFAEDEALASADSPQSHSDFNGSAVTDENPIVSGCNVEETPPPKLYCTDYRNCYQYRSYHRWIIWRICVKRNKQ